MNWSPPSGVSKNFDGVSKYSYEKEHVNPFLSPRRDQSPLLFSRENLKFHNSIRHKIKTYFRSLIDPAQPQIQHKAIEPLSVSQMESFRLQSLVQKFQ